ncbi:zf-HC2 domain-containing protein [Streptosporangium longisporum]|uniref:Putative zinc-finger domain-containing protein n=1 Tax=Streptosporangium longisporum TaxID=46187 RepID=A0ABP6KEI3_9ACTN
MSGKISQGDAELLAATRNGDPVAYRLLHRRHAHAAHALAGLLVRDEAGGADVVEETFTEVHRVVARGDGPEQAFRIYLLTALRRLVTGRAATGRVTTDRTAEGDGAADRARDGGTGRGGAGAGDGDASGDGGTADGTGGEPAGGKTGALDPGAPLTDPASAALERSPVARAFRSLPERWQLVLWHAEVERTPPEETALLLGLTVGGTGALAYRAREGMRQACLRIHLAESHVPECRPVLARLGPYVRGSLARAHGRVVNEHLDGCSGCRAVFTEVTGIGRSLRSVVGPLVVGPAFPAYLAALGRLGTADEGGLPGLWRRTPRSTRRALIAGAAVTAVVVAVAAVLVLAPDRREALPPSAASEPIVAFPIPGASTPDAGTTGPGTSRAGTPGVDTPGAGTPGVPSPGARDPLAPPQDGTDGGTGSGTDGGTPGAVPPPAGSPSGPAGVTPGAPVPHLVATIDVMGALVRSKAGIVALRLRNAGGGPSGEVVADVVLPRGVTLPSGSPRGHAVGVVTPVGTVDGWSCRARSRGARCVRGPLPAGRVTAVFLRVMVSDQAVPGAAPSVTVSAPGTRTAAGARTGVRSSGAPARFATDGRVAVSAIGNTLLSCDPSRPECESARARQGGRRDNNGWRMRLLDRDTDPSTRVSSAARLLLPPASKVVWAGLYWSASAPPGGRIRFKAPGESGYRQVRASEVVQRELPVGRGYQAFADVTRLLGRVSGTYWVADPSVRAGVSRHAGWGLVVIVADPRRPYGQAVVVDDATVLGTGRRSVRIPLDGLTSARMAARMALVTWEGDADVRGDRVRVGGRTLRPVGGGRDPRNPFDGSATGARGGATFGTDVDRFRAPLGRDPVLELGTRQDVLLFGVAAVSVQAVP